MKVGLCCCYENHNYGSMLQSLANFTAIELLGCKCQIIKYERKLTASQKVRQMPRMFNAGNVYTIRRRIRLDRVSRAMPSVAASRRLRDLSFDSFRERVFDDHVRVCTGWKSLCDTSADFDAVVVGSDQLWLPAGLPTNFYNLQFVHAGVRRVSYATSFGVAKIPWYQRIRTREFLKRIDCLSVREDSAADICRRVAGVEAKVVVDPTMLLTREQWLSLIPPTENVRKPYIFCYFLGSNEYCREEACRLSHETALPIVAPRHLDEIVPADEAFGDEAPYDVDPAGFLNLIRDAEYVLTDSFHGTVFSILNHKRFVTFYRFPHGDPRSRNSRIDTLLSNTRLHDRLVEDGDDVLSAVTKDADYVAADARISFWRDFSWQFLKGALYSG